MIDTRSTEDRLKELLRGVRHGDGDVASQVEHRLALARAWSVRDGDRILEIGCGQGETTVILATLVGSSGHVVAVDTSPDAYGKPPLRDAHAFIKAQPFGQRVDFLTATNVLDGFTGFAPGEFDLAILSHSPWYMGSLTELRALLDLCRVWSKRLGYAEWDMRPQRITQMPHMLAALLQGYVQALHIEQKGHPLWTGNIRTIILAGDARRAAIEAGWRVVSEGVHDTSAPLSYCQAEIEKALSMADWAAAAPEIPSWTRDMVNTQRRLLAEISTADAVALSTYAFTAE